MKRLYRSKSNKVIAGVCAGLADYMNLDATFVRLVFVLLLLMTGVFPFVILYIIAAVMMPEGPSTSNMNY